MLGKGKEAKKILPYLDKYLETTLSKFNEVCVQKKISLYAGEDKKFYYARAEVKNNQVIVYSDSVPNPVAVRYGWADDMPEVNLYNTEGLPASPFRTDTWMGITEAAKYRIR